MKSVFPKAFYDLIQNHPRKYLGQNFLTDNNVIKKISYSADLSATDSVLEIGPGFGILTKYLAETASEVTAIEKDNLLFKYLKDNLTTHPNLSLINADFLDVNLHKLFGNKKIKVVANLPYSVASQIIFKLLESGINIELMILMVQKEMGERICSQPDNKSYGAFTVLVHSYMNARIKFKVSPNSFWPKPNVDSVVIELSKWESKLINPDERTMFNKVVKSAFHSRRKKMINNLKNLADINKLKSAYKDLGFEENIRAEMLSLTDFINLTKALIK